MHVVGETRAHWLKIVVCCGQKSEVLLLAGHQIDPIHAEQVTNLSLALPELLKVNQIFRLCTELSCNFFLEFTRDSSHFTQTWGFEVRIN